MAWALSFGHRWRNDGRRSQWLQQWRREWWRLYADVPRLPAHSECNVRFSYTVDDGDVDRQLSSIDTLTSGRMGFFMAVIYASGSSEIDNLRSPEPALDAEK